MHQVTSNNEGCLPASERYGFNSIKQALVSAYTPYWYLLRYDAFGGFINKLGKYNTAREQLDTLATRWIQSFGAIIETVLINNLCADLIPRIVRSAWSVVTILLGALYLILQATFLIAQVLLTASLNYARLLITSALIECLTLNLFLNIASILISVVASPFSKLARTRGKESLVHIKDNLISLLKIAFYATIFSPYIIIGLYLPEPQGQKHIFKKDEEEKERLWPFNIASYIPKAVQLRCSNISFHGQKTLGSLLYLFSLPVFALLTILSSAGTALRAAFSATTALPAVAYISCIQKPLFGARYWALPAGRLEKERLYTQDAPPSSGKAIAP